MITYRTASTNDIQTVAQLHARSWQLHYRGILSDQYLDHEIEAERLDVWTKRMKTPNEEQYIVIAFDGDTPCGFGCVFLHHDPEYGALLDNLHVAYEWKGKGIGRVLMQKTAAWVKQQAPDEKYYLMVWKDNLDAIRFYERMGGKRVKTFPYKISDDRYADVHVYLWEDLSSLSI